MTLEDGFVLVGRIGQERFFERVYHDCGQPAIHAWMLVYPADQQAFYEKIVEKLSAGYRGSGKGSESREQCLRRLSPTARPIASARFKSDSIALARTAVRDRAACLFG